jgi:hypothetical protein
MLVVSNCCAFNLKKDGRRVFYTACDTLHLEQNRLSRWQNRKTQEVRDALQYMR